MQGKLVITVTAFEPYEMHEADIAYRVTEAIEDGTDLEDVDVTVETAYDGPLTQAGSDGVYAANH